MKAVETSKTRKIYLLLKERIVSGFLLPGERLPGEPSLAAAHGVSRVTIRRALEGLARDGLIERQAGSGTYVKGQRPTSALTGDFANMLQNLIAMGRATRVRLLAFNYLQPPQPVANALGLAQGETAQHSIRVRYLDGEPFSYLSTYVPARIGMSYSEADLATSPLLELLERSGVEAASAAQTLSAILAGPEVADALGVETGSALISMTRVVRDRQGRGVEFLSALYRPDKHQFHMALKREGKGADRRWYPEEPRSFAKPFAQPTDHEEAGQQRI